MTVIANNDHVARIWQRAFTRVQALAAARGAHLASTVVLVPYAQLMAEARRQWQRLYPQGFAPRFETTRNWAQALGGPIPEAGDFTGDAARDGPAARALLEQAGLSAHRETLAGPLLDMAAQLSAAAAAVAPAGRRTWAEAARAQMPAASDGASALRLESFAARIALEWVLASPHASDVLFEPGVRAAVELLVVLEGFHPDPLAQTLLAHWGDAGCAVALAEQADAPVPHAALHAVEDAEGEAQRAAACVLAHLAEGRAPVALAAGDRALTRRIAALLEGAGVPVHDENGWTLSTTRAAAGLMAALRACAWNATADDVLDWLKSGTPEAAALRALERWLRRHGARHWSAAAAGLQGHPTQARASALAAQAEAWRAPLRAARPLGEWLHALRGLLSDCGLWDELARDAAGERVLAELRLAEGLDADMQAWPGAARPMGLPDFTRWVDEVLESARFRPEYREGAPVTVLPLPQLLARPFAALVLPGCDEKRLQAAPEPPGHWTAAQRAALGLPTREQLAAVQRAAWGHALGTPRVDILWRTGDEGGEPLLASPLVLALQQGGGGAPGEDARTLRAIAPVPVPRPLPVGDQLPVRRLSSSAYADLRHCPYRFFALRQLALQEDDELDAQIGKRDFGTWLHAVLQHFHEALRDAPTTDRISLMDAAVARATHEQRLHDADFLPYASGWPQLRDGYLNWLEKHEATGATFRQAELEASQPLGTLELVGKLDRVDDADGMPLVIDYKTEADAVTARRIKAGCEDTQLAFYAALMPDDRLRAAYVNVGERGDTRLHEQDDVVLLRDQLIESIQSDMARIAQGAPLPALGEGSVCEWCEARGLCRKDFWQ